MKHTRWFTVLSIMTALILSGFVMGQEMQKEMKIMHPTGGEKGCSPGCPHMKEMLQLTEEQQKKIETLKSALDKELLDLKADLRVKKAELEKLLIAENPSKTAIEKKIDEIGALRTRIHKALVNHKLAIREILTPEQRIKFDQMTHPGCKMGKEMRILKRGVNPMPPHSMKELEPEESLDE